MSDENKKEESGIQADNNGIAIGRLNIGGDVRGNIQIGHTAGYTAEQVAVLIAQIQSTFQPKPFDGRCPYKGLDAFEEDDAELFFGREKLVDDLVSRVKDSRTVFVTGPSGSGKSSLVRAGLIHTLKQGAIKGSGRWLYATMKPGRDPIGELGRVVSSLASSTNPEDEIRAKAMKDATIFARWCEIVLKEGRDKRLILFIDQFEEVFTQINNEAERVAFLNLLTHAATIENGRVIILFSMRSDFVSNCATYPQLNALLNQQFVQIGAMQPEELVSAIAQPALRVGLRIDPDLIAQIINEMKGEPGTLPLMQFALKDLFDSQQEKSGVIALTLNDYLQRGGIHKALERHADDSFSKLSNHEQELARSIFSGLIEIGRGTQDTKRTALFDELVPANTRAADVETIVQKLADARLITTDEQAGKNTLTISHEKLIDAWPWLKKLVNENRDVIALQNEILTDAKEWDEHKRDVSYLYTGGRLTNVDEQLKVKKIIINDLAREFFQEGYIRRQRGRWTLTGGIAAIFILLITAVIIFSSQSTENKYLAQQNASIANTAQAASTYAVAQQSTAQANAVEVQNQTNISLSRQLIAQSQSLLAGENSKELPAVLLAIQSMHMFPTGEASQILQNNTFVGPVESMLHNGPVNDLAYSLDGNYLVSGSLDDTVRVWEVITGKEISRMKHEDDVNVVSFSPNGKYVASGSSDKTARLWETITGKEIFRMNHEDVVTKVVFSPDGKYILSGSWDNSIRVWEISTGKEISYMAHKDTVNLVTFSPDGRYIISGSRDKTVRMWETITGKEIYHVTQNSTINALAISPDGNYLIIAGCNYPDTISHCKKGSVIVLDSTTGKEVAHVVHDGIVTAVAISLDSKYVVSGSSDNTARVSSITTGKEVSHINHDSVVNTVSFSPDGKYVVSGSNDLVVRVWEATTGREFARMTHLDSISIARFSPDNKLIASGSADGIIQVWSWDPEELIAKTCLRVSRNLTRVEWKQYINDALPYQAICPNLSLDLEYITVIAQDSLSNTNDVHRIDIALNKTQTELLKINTINNPFAESIIIVRKAISKYVISEVSAGRIKSALELLEQANQSNISIDDKYALNDICWFGSLNGLERDVLKYCDANVNLNPSVGNYYDSRGLARALTGDYQGAILDFQYYVDNNSADSDAIQQRKQWIEQLEQGINPFNFDVLESLKSQ